MMKQRIRYIIILVSVCAIGIGALQFYWINRLYKTHQEQLIKEINIALENSVKYEMQSRYQQQAQVLFSGNNATVVAIQRSESDTMKLDAAIQPLLKQMGVKHSTLKFDIGEMQLVDNDSLSNEIPDNLQVRLKEVFGRIITKELESEIPVNKNKIDSLFHVELEKRNIEGEYWWEEVTKSDSLTNYSTPGNLMTSKVVYANLLGTKGYRVLFKNSTQLILQRMIWGVTVSFFLVVLMLFSFGYMLRTIFRQKQLSEVKNDFINNMTHELKTPIATVLAAVEGMRNFGILDDREKSMKYLSVSKNELQRLSGLVENVLTMAREEREPLKLDIEMVDFRALCLNTISSFKLKEYGKEVEIDFNGSDECRCKADRLHMVNVLQNLIENSIKYSNETVAIKVNCLVDQKYLVLQVEDNGVGISRKHQARIFEQFYRVPTGNIHNVKGFGLGLHYVHKIVSKHNGVITVESNSGEGAKFTIKIPQ
ncbi:HAMP domain-containing histidine kinase [Prolixibacteraceae bacterium JC049]|nr:HAMP domain-containing histidine kinase [Prolixibacteraceae bacterium JC049]